MFKALFATFIFWRQIYQAMMNITSRQFNNESMLYQSMAQFPSRKNRFLASTGMSNLNNSMQTTKLPQLSRSFSSSKSTKLKLTTIEATLCTIDQQLHELKLDTRESRRYCNFLKDDLAQGKLGSLRLDMMGLANKLQKMFKLSKKHDEDRTTALKKDCHILKQSSANLTSMMSILQQKIDKCQNIMGIYSGKQKHKV